MNEKRALRLLEEVLEIEAPEARDAFLVKHCFGEPELLNHVRRLLAFSDTRDSPFMTGHRGSLVDLPLPVPARVGPYKVIEEIAQGGMGAVLRAERDDGVFQQTVAIKLIRGGLASDAARARFDEERRILARLNHAGIVRIIDGGEVEQRPWLAMDFIAGEPIDTALDHNAASREERLNAFVRTCEALAYAHRQLVIHADIKPSNVLMDDEGGVHLLDFGISRLIVDIDPIEGGDPYPRTQGYAAPERAAGAAPTIAGDVFSLGMLLLDVLGCPNHAGTKPCLHGTRLPAGVLAGDIAAIAARALAEDPAARYPDVPALIEDLRRMAANQPVAAMGVAGWRYFASKFVRRHSRGLAISAAFGLALLIASTVSTLLYLRAEQARAQADARFLEVRRIAHFMLFDHYDRLADAPGTVDARVQLARAAATYLDALRAVPDAPADMRIETAQGYRRLATIEGFPGTSSLGDPKSARLDLDRAETVLHPVIAEHPSDAAAQEGAGWIANAHWTLGADTSATSRFATEAAAHFRRALAIDPRRTGATLGLLAIESSKGYDLIWSENRPADAIPVLRAALARLRATRFDAEQQRGVQLLELTLLGRIGDALYHAGNIPGSLGLYREERAIVIARLAHARAVPWIDKRGDVAFNIGATLADMPGRATEGLREIEAGEEGILDALAFGPDANIEKRLLVLYNAQATALIALGRPAEAVAASRQSIALRRARLAHDPHDPQRNRDIAVALLSHADVLAKARNKPEACAAARESAAQWLHIRAMGNLGKHDATHGLPDAQALQLRLCG